MRASSRSSSLRPGVLDGLLESVGGGVTGGKGLLLDAGGLAGCDRREYMRAEILVAPAWKKDERVGLWVVVVADSGEGDEESLARSLDSSASYSAQRSTAAVAFWFSWKTWVSSSAMRAWASSSCVDGGSSCCGGITKPQLGQHDGLGSTKSDVVFDVVKTMVDDMLACLLLVIFLCSLAGFRLSLGSGQVRLFFFTDRSFARNLSIYWQPLQVMAGHTHTMKSGIGAHQAPKQTGLKKPKSGGAA